MKLTAKDLDEMEAYKNAGPEVPWRPDLEPTWPAELIRLARLGLDYEQSLENGKKHDEPTKN
jgi:hypothetical protein